MLARVTRATRTRLRFPLQPRSARFASVVPAAQTPSQATNADLPTWKHVDTYFESKFLPHAENKAPQRALDQSDKAGLPWIAVSPCHGKMLAILARMTRAKRILEVGTLGGYSSIWLGREAARFENGHVTTVESEPLHVSVAEENIEAAGLTEVVRVRCGTGVDVLRQLAEEQVAPFDFVFIDADKPNNRNYVEGALKLSRPGTVMVLDNVVRNGAVVDAKSKDAAVRGVRDSLDYIEEHPRLDGTAVQTVGSKGYDGFAIATVL